MCEPVFYRHVVIKKMDSITVDTYANDSAVVLHERSTVKKYLLVYNDMSIGGIEKSIISLLNSIDYSMVEVDLLLLKKRGPLLKSIPKEVTIYESGIQGNLNNSIIGYFHEVHSPIWRLRRLKSSVIGRLGKKNIPYEGAQISYWAKLVQRIDKEYDVAIAYVDWTFDYVINYVKADRKYFYIHVDYDKAINHINKDKQLVKKATGVFGVSKDCVDVLKNDFPESKDKISVWKNVISVSHIKKESNEKQPFKEDQSTTKMLTVARLSEEKGIDLCIEAAKYLSDQGIDFVWCFVGDGPLRTKLEQYAERLKISQNLRFVGQTDNPYPYFKNCDIYVQLSRHEGYGYTLAEARIFGKPCIVSNIDCFAEQIEQGKNGYLCDLDPVEAANLIIGLVKNKDLYEKISKRILQETVNNEEALRVFYQL